MKTILIKQACGATRVIAVSDDDARAIRNDRAMIDAVRPLGVVDVDRDGKIECGPTGPLWQDVPSRVRDALMEGICR